MKNASVLVQTALLLIAVSLLFFYVWPAFSAISAEQDKISEYDEAISQAAEVNNLLNSLKNEIESIPNTDRNALQTYLPETIDPITVQRDIKAYVDRHSLQLTSMGQGELSSFGTGGYLQQQEFSVIVTGEYQAVKNMLRDTERNPYPLHIVDLIMAPASAASSEVQADITFITYQFISDNQ